jgi:phosphoglycolate phosphatase
VPVVAGRRRRPGAGAGQENQVTIRGIIFDKDGTLFNFQATWAIWAEQLLSGLMGERAGDLARVVGFDMASRRFAPDSPVIAETTSTLAGLMLPLLPGWDRPRLVSHMKALAAAVPLAEAVPLKPYLQGLTDRGLVLGLATNDDETSAQAQLGRAGIAGAFRFIAGYDSGHGGKPAPGQLLAFLALTGLAPGEVAMVGDSRHDLDAGRAAGMHTVGVLTGPATAEVLAPLADVVLPDIGHLPGWIDRMAPVPAA